MKSGAAHTKAVTRHYASTPVLAKILSALRAAGRDLDHLTVDDLAPLDQLHSGGKDATFDLARLAGVSRKMQVLDVGGGLGGPARLLARETGCRVTVIDLTEEFCRGGEDLTARTSLAGQVRFWHGSALEVPCPAASFDLSTAR